MKNFIKRYLVFLCILTVSFFELSYANQVGVDTHTFNPSPLDSSGFTLFSPQQNSQRSKFYLSSWLDYSKNTLGNFSDINTSNNSDYSDYAVMSHILFNYNFKSLSLGFSAPYLVSYSENKTNFDLKYTSTGLVEFRPHISWSTSITENLSMLIYSSLNFNFLADNFYFGDDSNPTLNFLTAMSYKLQQTYLNFNFGYRKRTGSTNYSLSPIEIKPSHFIYGLGVFFPILNKKKLFGAVELTGSLSNFDISNPLERDSSSSELLFGVNKKFKNSNLKTGFVIGTSGQREEVANYRLFVGFGLNFLNSAPPSNLAHSKEDLVLVAKFIIPHIYFDFDKSKLNQKGRAEIKRIISTVNSRPRLRKIIISGHTDAHGSDSYNLSLGEARAKTVNAYLLGFQDKTEIMSYGESKPLPSANSKFDDENRRVEVKIYE